MTFEFTESASGRKVGKTCLAQTEKNRKKRRCTRTVVAGMLTLPAHEGTNKVHFDGRISKHKKLKPGRYTLSCHRDGVRRALNAGNAPLHDREVGGPVRRVGWPVLLATASLSLAPAVGARESRAQP